MNNVEVIYEGDVQDTLLGTSSLAGLASQYWYYDQWCMVRKIRDQNDLDLWSAVKVDQNRNFEYVLKVRVATTLLFGIKGRFD